jgi:hypothetical protein
MILLLEVIIGRNGLVSNASKLGKQMCPIVLVWEVDALFALVEDRLKRFVWLILSLVYFQTSLENGTKTTA